MKRQLCALWCLTTAMGGISGCGGKTNSLTAPTGGDASSAAVTALNITGAGALTAPGQTSQLSAEAVYRMDPKRI
jgi:hypothetical protein